MSRRACGVRNGLQQLVRIQRLKRRCESWRRRPPAGDWFSNFYSFNGTDTQSPQTTRQKQQTNQLDNIKSVKQGRVKATRRTANMDTTEARRRLSALVMAWATDADSGEPKYILEVGTGLACRCVCVPGAIQRWRRSSRAMLDGEGGRTFATMKEEKSRHVASWPVAQLCFVYCAKVATTLIVCRGAAVQLANAV